MPYAVVLYFEEQAEQEFLKIWKSLAREGLSVDLVEAEIRPHFTLAIFDQLDCQPCETELAKIAAETPSIHFQITHFGVFTEPEPVVFAAPTLTEEFLSFHRHLYEVLGEDFQNPWEMYLPGRWVPHCTLAIGFNIDELGKVFEKCLQLNLPMEIKANQVGVVEFQPMRDLFRFRFLDD